MRQPSFVPGRLVAVHDFQVSIKPIIGLVIGVPADPTLPVIVFVPTSTSEEKWTRIKRTNLDILA